MSNKLITSYYFPTKSFLFPKSCPDTFGITLVFLSISFIYSAKYGAHRLNANTRKGFRFQNSAPNNIFQPQKQLFAYIIISYMNLINKGTLKCLLKYIYFCVLFLAASVMSRGSFSDLRPCGGFPLYVSFTISMLFVFI